MHEKFFFLLLRAQNSQAGSAAAVVKNAGGKFERLWQKWKKALISLKLLIVQLVGASSHNQSHFFLAKVDVFSNCSSGQWVMSCILLIAMVIGPHALLLLTLVSCPLAYSTFVWSKRIFKELGSFHLQAFIFQYSLFSSMTPYLNNCPAVIWSLYCLCNGAFI